MVESEMADLARENGLRSREVCQGLERTRISRIHAAG
jgi:hypothetical protein